MNYNKYIKYIPHLAITLIALSAGLILYFILRYGIDVPYMDQWEYVHFFSHAAKGTLTFNELFALQCEYRQLFPNLIFVGLGWLTHWNVKYEMLVIFLLACITSFNVYRLALHTLNVKPWLLWVLLFVANLFIFSPIQYENWLFGVQIQYLMPIACISSCMLIAFSKIKPTLKLLFCILLSVISSYSAVNGMICWFVVFPVLFFSGNSAHCFKRWPFVLSWCAATLLTITFYFIDYQSPKNFPSPFEFLNQPKEAIRYFFGILGNPVRIVHSLEHIIKVGGVLFGLFCLLCLYIVRYLKNKELFMNAIVWLMIAFYSLITSAMITTGRLGFGVYQSLTSRYTSYTLYLAVAVVFLFALVLKHMAQKYRFKLLHKSLISIIIICVIYIKVDTYPMAVTDLKNFSNNMLHGKAGLMFINYFPHEHCEVKNYLVHFDELKVKANILDNLGFLRPPLVKSNNIGLLESEESGDADYGSFDYIKKLDDSTYIAAGTSHLQDTSKPAHAVILTFNDKNDNPIFFSLYNGHNIKWEKTFNTSTLSSGIHLMRAWAYDARKGKVYKLKGSYLIRAV